MYIFCWLALASHRWCQLSSNVRPHMRSAEEFNHSPKLRLPLPSLFTRWLQPLFSSVALAGQKRSSPSARAVCLHGSSARVPAKAAENEFLHLVVAARPNPLLKPSPNGGPPGPASRYRVHFLLAGPGVPPLVPS